MYFYYKNLKMIYELTFKKKFLTMIIKIAAYLKQDKRQDIYIDKDKTDKTRQIYIYRQ